MSAQILHEHIQEKIIIRIFLTALRKEEEKEEVSMKYFLIFQTFIELFPKMSDVNSLAK